MYDALRCIARKTETENVSNLINYKIYKKSFFRCYLYRLTSRKLYVDFDQYDTYKIVLQRQVTINQN